MKFHEGESNETAHPPAGMMEPAMDTLGMLISWLQEAINGIAGSLSDPKYWGLILSVLTLLAILSIVRSVRRLTREVASTLTELSEIKAVLKEIERSLGRFQAKPFSVEKGARDIWNIPLKEEKDQL